MFSVGYQGVPSAPQRGNGGAGERPRLCRQQGNTHPSPHILHHLLASLALGAKPQFQSIAGLGWACPSAQGQTQHQHPPASPGYRQRQEELTLCRQKGFPLGEDGAEVSDCCWFGSELVCVIRFALLHPHPEHPADSSAQQGPSAPHQNAEHPVGPCVGLARKKQVSKGS